MTDTTLATFDTFDSGSNSSVFVAFSDDDPVAPLNEAPTADRLDLEVPEGDLVSFSLSADDDSTPAEQLRYVIESLPVGGVLTSNGVPVSDGQIFVGSPQLEFEMGTDGSTLVTSFVFRVVDSGNPPLISDYALVTMSAVEAVGAGEVTIDSGGVVRIGGTAGNDQFVIQASGDNLRVKHNGQVISQSIPLAAATEIRVWGRDGDDIINVKGLSIETVLWGGRGDDRLYGGHGNDLLFGGLGDDVLRGRRGSDLVVGGWDADEIRGNRDNDILVGGTFGIGVTLSQLDSVLTDWETNLDPG